MTTPIAHYRRHKSTYDTIAEQLDTVRDIFMSADRFTQKVMLFDSSVFAVTSVQNDISILRTAFRSYCRADNWDEVRGAMESVNYGNNKFDYIRANFDAIFSQTGDSIIDALEAGAVWGSVNIMVNELMGVSFIKAPFIPCMLGFKSLMCVDTNVAQMVPDSDVKAKGYSSINEYMNAISLIKDEFPELTEELSTFMLQWVVFDANRGDGVARHEEWFEHMLPGSPFGRQAGLDEF